MKFKIVIKKAAVRFIKSQPKQQQERLYKAISNLPDKGDIKVLIGHNDIFRLRVGNYRVIFEKKDEVFHILVIDVGNRGQIYRGL